MDIIRWSERDHHDYDSDQGGSSHRSRSRHSHHREAEEADIIDVAPDINVVDSGSESHFETWGQPVDKPIPPLLPDASSLRLLDEVRLQNEDTVRELLDAGANPGTINAEGQTSLHLAVENHDVSMIQLLAEKGGDQEAADSNGYKPLFLAAKLGLYDMVDVLLSFKPSIESLNTQNGKTAFLQAIENNYRNIAELLLDNRADIDATLPNGHTALSTAVISGNLDLVNFLLRHGANKKIELEDGRTIEDVAEGDNAMTVLLRSSQLLEGPSIPNPINTPGTRFMYTPSLPANNLDKLYACRGFEATIIDFFGGDRERRIQVSSPIYDVLYGKGPEAIMSDERGNKMSGQQAMFRWYHLPANNMEWVQILASRISSEHHSAELNLDEDMKSKLALTNSPGRQYLATTANSSFMRPLTRVVKARTELDNLAADQKRPDHVMLFIPYLHFETYGSYRKMNQVVMDIRSRLDPKSQQAYGPTAAGHREEPRRSRQAGPAQINVSSIGPKGPPPTYAPLGTTTTSSSVSESTVEVKGPFGFLLRGSNKLKSTYQTLKEKSRLGAFSLGQALGKTEQSEDVEKGVLPTACTAGLDTKAPSEPISPLEDSPKETEAPAADASQSNAGPQGSLEGITGEETKPVRAGNDIYEISPAAPIVNEQQGPAAGASLGASKQPSLPLGLVPETHIPLVTSNDQVMAVNSITEPTASDFPEQNTAQAAHSPVEDNAQTSPSKQRKKPRVFPGTLDEHLLKAYLQSNKPGEVPPLQLRRTLDQYYYTHLANTAGRDSDQVVYRYTLRTNQQPKIFMVDQLWLWILNDARYLNLFLSSFNTDTVISCCPQRWDITGNYKGVAPQAPAPLPPQGYGRPGAASGRPTYFSGHPPGAKLVSRSHQTASKQTSSSQHPRQSSTAQPPLPLPNWLPPMPALWQPAPGEPEFMVLDSDQTPKHKPKRKPEKIGGVLEWLAGPKKGKSSDQTGPTRPPKAESSFDSDYDASDDGNRRTKDTVEAKRKRQAQLRNDPLNVHQMVLKHLQGSARAPIASVKDLQNLIIDSVVNVFDQYQVPDEFQFFEFFERSIGAVIDQEARYFQQFASALKSASRYPTGPNSNNSDALFSITDETQLLGEIKDINDELNILQMVLNDQLSTLKEFSELMHDSNSTKGKQKDHDHDEKSPAMVRIENIKSHMQKLAKMERLAEKTYKSLNHLLDLKQKQANVSEALIARKQAEKMAAQAEIAAQHAEKGMDQAELAYKLSMDSARQGRTVLLFTVITIIFLPLSFVAAFFAINIDAFPVNANGKLPMNYVLKYMFSISGAVSIPFVLVAFNQDRIASWVRGHNKVAATWFTVIIAVVILISVVWTHSSVSGGMKAALTIVVVLVVIVAALGHLIYALVSVARQRFDSSYYSGSMRSPSLANE